MQHPQSFFGVTRDNTIIPLRLEFVRDIGNGSFIYSIGINQLNPSANLIQHHKNDFKDRIVTEDSSLFSRGSMFCETLQEAKRVVREKLMKEREKVTYRLDEIDRQIANINKSAAEFERIQYQPQAWKVVL